MLILTVHFLRKKFTSNLCSLFWLLGSKLIKRYGSTASVNFSNSINDELKLQRVV